MTVSSRGAKYEEILELKNGCLCCSMKDNGLLAIQNLVRFDARTLGANHSYCECSADDKEGRIRLCLARNQVRLTFSTVSGLIPSRSAISGTLWPDPASTSISSSRSVISPGLDRAA